MTAAAGETTGKMWRGGTRRYVGLAIRCQRPAGYNGSSGRVVIAGGSEDWARAETGDEIEC